MRSISILVLHGMLRKGLDVLRFLSSVRARLARFRSDNRGQVIVEWVLVTPLQLFLALALLQVALAYQAYHLVQYAAYQAARAALSAPCHDTARPDTQQALEAHARAAALPILAAIPRLSGTADDTLQVTVDSRSDRMTVQVSLAVESVVPIAGSVTKREIVCSFFHLGRPPYDDRKGDPSAPQRITHAAVLPKPWGSNGGTEP